jgi:dihydroflavonol-4-reductase
MKCLVTGATGFLGTNLVHELVKDGWEVRALRRFGSVIKYIKNLPIEIVFGDVTDGEEMDKAVQGMDVVFHVAGDTSWWKKNYDAQAHTNVDGPVTVARSCIKNGVRRLVHTSTCDALGYNPAGLADETWDDYTFAGMGYHYGDTKREGEIKLQQFSKDIEIVILNPGNLIGPFDFTLQFGRLFFDLRDGKLPGCPIGGGSFAHVCEVSKAHIEAAKRGRPGENYLCTGHNISHRKLFQSIAEKFGKSAPRFDIPRWAAVAYGYTAEYMSNFTHKIPEVNPGMARYLSVHTYYDASKAVRELDYKIVPLQEMIDGAYDWYQKNGFL